MRRTLLLTCVVGALTLSGIAIGDEPEKAASPAVTEVKPAASISDRDLSLYPGSVFAVPDPAAIAWNAVSPGDNERLPRAFPIAPPRIPHAIADFLPLTLRSNGCLDCHALDAGADAPELPASHRTDLRNSPGQVGAAATGARYLCLACHVPTSDAAPVRASRLPGP
jgi:cytochrome c-type protein NapB